MTAVPHTQLCLLLNRARWQLPFLCLCGPEDRSSRFKWDVSDVKITRRKP